MKTQSNATISSTHTLTLSEVEARALDALAGYGADAFLRVFYTQLGESYLRPHEAGLRALFSAIGALRADLDRAERARQVFSGRMVASPCPPPHDVAPAPGMFGHPLPLHLAYPGDGS